MFPAINKILPKIARTEKNPKLQFYRLMLIDLLRLLLVWENNLNNREIRFE